MSNIFHQEAPCNCHEEIPEHSCCCTPDERVLRGYAYCGLTEPMTSEQREWCYNEAESAGEGSYPREEAVVLSDCDLAKWVLHAWSDYVSGML